MNQFKFLVITFLVIISTSSGYAKPQTTPPTPWANKLDEAKAARDELLKKEVAGLREMVEQLRLSGTTKVSKAMVDKKIAELNLRIDNLLSDPNSPLAKVLTECGEVRQEITAIAQLVVEANRKADLALEGVKEVKVTIETEIKPKLEGLIVSDQVNTGKIAKLEEVVEELKKNYSGSTIRVGAHLWVASDLEGAYGGLGFSLNFLDSSGEFFGTAGIGGSGQGLAWTLRFGRMWKMPDWEDFLLGLNLSAVIDQGEMSNTSTSHFTVGVGPSFRYFLGSSHEVSIGADVFVGLKVDEYSQDAGFGTAFTFEYRPSGK